MRWDFSIVRALAGMEFRTLLRDPRVFVMGVLLPLIAMPLLIFGSTWTVQKREQKLRDITVNYAITGPKAAWARTVIEHVQERSSASTNTHAPFKGREITVTNGLAALNAGEIHVLVDARNPEARKKPRARHPATGREGKQESVVSAVPVLRLTWRANVEESTAAMDRMQQFLEGAREAHRFEVLAEHGLVVPEKAVAIQSRDLASPARTAGVAVGRYLTLLLLFFIMTGGAIVALDALAGEKERGTLETLLVSGASRHEIIAAKLCAISVVGLVVTLSQIASGLVFESLKLVLVPVNILAAFTPAAFAGLMIVYLPMVAFVSAVLLFVSGRARSYKEAQLHFFPVMLLCLVPALVPLFPVSLRSVFVLVPISNTALSAREILVGNFDWPFLAFAWLTTAGAAVWVVKIAVGSITEDRFVLPAADGPVGLVGPAQFGRHVLVWFAVIWALLLVVSNYLQSTGMRVQLLVNLVPFLLGGSLLMIWRYRLPVVQTLSLRAPPASAWLAVACGVPGGMLAATGLFRLLNLVMPIPKEMLDTFGDELLPKDLTITGLMVFLVILPALIEEIAFRGVLLQGLARRMSPLAAVLTVGVVFGLFHMALFRFAPTFALGVFLAFITLFTRSIYPAMLWHALNNALGVWAEKQHLPLAELEPPYYFLGAAALAVSLWIVWRNRVEEAPRVGKRGE